MVTKAKRRPISQLWREIEAALKRKGENQTWLAEELDLTPQAITKWKYDGKISKAKAIEVSDLLDIPLDRLLGGKVNPVGEVLEALPVDMGKTFVRQLMYQIEHADESVMSQEHSAHYLKAMADFIKDLERRKKQ